MIIPRPFHLSFEQNTGPSIARSVVSQMAIPSPYKWLGCPEILNSISICQFEAVSGNRDHSHPHCEGTPLVSRMCLFVLT